MAKQSHWQVISIDPYANLSGDVIITLNRLFEQICTRCRLNKLTAFWKVWSNDYETWSVCAPTVACELFGYIRLTMQSRTKQTNSESSAGERHVSHSTVPIVCYWKKMRYLQPKLTLRQWFYKKTHRVSVWGNCSIARLYEIENLHIKICRCETSQQHIWLVIL